MKYVQKWGAPHQYRRWCREVKGTNKEDYREIPGGMKLAVLAALVKEQGEICAYTMKRIDAQNSHIEHIKPESLCRSDRKGSDLDFDNMLACFPRDGMSRACRYGAQKKDHWWDSSLFISPLICSCEQRFRFNLEGEISVVGSNAAARKTIEVLALDHATLTEDRRRAIHEFIYGKGGDRPLSKAKATQLSHGICNRTGGHFVEFCVAFRDALEEYTRYVEKMARRREFAKRAAR